MQNNNLIESYFPVKEMPAIKLNKDGNDDLTKTGYKFIVREDTGDVLSCVTDSYKLITTVENCLKKEIPILHQIPL